MRSLITTITHGHTPESLVARLRDEPGVVLLRSALFDSTQARYSLVTARPFLTFRSFGSRCELIWERPRDQKTPWSLSPLYGNPWHILDGLLFRYELLDQMDLPFPL